jgi:CDP-diacylglycerol--serine O-phosphatidyltransferase
MKFRRPRRMLPRLQGVPVRMVVPNLITLLGLCAGLTAIRFAHQERWEAAVLAILIAAFMDGIDGRVARLLKGTSKFGEELDSLADFVNFGVAPAFIVYFWSLHAVGGPGWAVAVFFAVCTVLRLARFNTFIGQADLPPYAYNFFTGVPSPAGGGLALLPLMLSFEFGPDFFSLPAINAAVLVGVGALMISRLPTFAFKRVRVPRVMLLPLFLGGALVAALSLTSLWLMFAAVLGLYLVSIPLSVRSYGILKKAADDIRTAPAPQK